MVQEGNVGLSFAGLLTLIFITLKLTSVINWSWLWVLSPIWLPAVLALTVAGIIYGVISLIELIMGD